MTATSFVGDGSGLTGIPRPIAAYAGGDQDQILDTAALVARSVTISVPSSGIIILNAAGYFEYASTGQDVARASLTTGTVIDFNYLTACSDCGCTSEINQVSSSSLTRGYSVAAGTHTYNLVFELFMGEVNVGDTNLNAIFIPD